MQGTLRGFLLVPLAFAFQTAVSLGHPATASQQSPPPAQSSQDQSASQAQTPAQDKPDSVAEAARKAKEKKAASAKGKVFTEDDLSGIKKDGVSVVGTEGKKPSNSPPATGKEEEDAPNGEKYWRGKARPILDEMAEIDQQIAELKEEIKKYGNGGFDITTGYKNNIAYIDDRNAQVQELQKKKANLQKKLDDLEEEGRKAGAQPAWFR
jgi:chromosome segregation ATPase